MRRSIRWELPLSYAAIALLAAVALGAILLLVLDRYYGQLERAYLAGNALAFSYSLAPMLEDGPPDESLQAQLTSLSFLSQARVRVLGPDGVPIADSSTPGRFAVSLPAPPEFAGTLPAWPEREVVALKRDGEAGASSSSLIAISPSLPEPAGIALTETLLPPLDARFSRTSDPYSSFRVRIFPVRMLPLAGREFPLFVGSDVDLDDPRSDQAVQHPIYDGEANLLGYVELSEGPAYRQEIVTSVARGWLLAGAVAVAVAAVVGWLVSRRMSAPLLALTTVTTSMAAGDLAARADVAHRDEFGTLARSFNAMADQVENTVVTLRRFVSDAAHELHTPLATLRTNLEMMSKDSPWKHNERVARAQAQVERLEALTQGMLNLSRVESGMSQEALGLVSLTSLAQEMGELYASQAEQAGIDFELALPETPVTIQGDDGQLRQALSNLLDNAIKFTPEGGRVCLGLGREGDMAMLWVEDTGIGIPEEDLPHLFQRFHRGRNASGYPGSGLGLAIVKAIADGHDGSVTVGGTGQGTLFTLRLHAE
jgi:signal transduction histidine kinase